MPDTDSMQARLVVKRILEQGLGEKPDGEPLTTSVGIATMSKDPSSLRDWRSLVDAADSAMYEAKRNGGNQIAFHESTGNTSKDPTLSLAT